MSNIRFCIPHGVFRAEECPTCGINGTRIVNMNGIRPISKHMAWALRHAPDEAGITVDDHGWADIQALARSANGVVAVSVTPQKLYAIAATDEKGRYETNNGRIRATNGHSIDVDVIHDTQEITIPDTLYHGTASSNVEAIQREGLCAMNRNNVHLSDTVDDATAVGKRHSEYVTVFAVNTESLQDNGYTISESGNGVYVVEHVPPEHISIEQKIE